MFAERPQQLFLDDPTASTNYLSIIWRYLIRLFSFTKKVLFGAVKDMRAISIAI